MELEGCRGRDHYRLHPAFCIVLISVMLFRSDVLLTFYIHHTHVIDMLESKLIILNLKLHSSPVVLCKVLYNVRYTFSRNLITI